MSPEYPGLSATARRFWSSFIRAAVGMGLFLVFTGAIGALLVFVFLPDVLWLFLIAAGSFALHSGGLYIRDVNRGQYDPGQTEFTSWLYLFAVVVVLGFMESTVLLLGTAGAYAIIEYTTLPLFAAIGVAIYYPVVDVLLSRRGVWTPGAVVMLLSSHAVATVLNFRRSVLNSLPIYGKNRKKRPQS